MIIIPKKLEQEIVAHCKKGYPKEACGILAGTGDEVKRVYPMANVEQSSISYFMDPKEQLKVFKSIREDNHEMLSIFHSHVASEAHPSQKDIRLAFYPDVSYIIVSLSDQDHPKMRSFKIDALLEKAVEEKISVV